jgi:hypothetical protein
MACFPPLEFGAVTAKSKNNTKPNLSAVIDLFCTRALAAATTWLMRGARFCQRLPVFKTAKN